MPGIIVPVKVATPDADGKVYHIVESGQSFWSIAIAYKITIADLETWNNISRTTPLKIGQKLFIPTSNTEGYATPTPVGMIQVSAPDQDGKIVHTVQAYQTLTTISQAYAVSIDRILSLNGLQADWPLQINQKLLIDPGHVTPSPTPKPLTPIEKLTPAADGKYYHTVSSGESLSYIAALYNISMADLMLWNGLNGASIIQPDQKLLLLVTPPATSTPTPGPATATPTASRTPDSALRSPSPTSPPTRAATLTALPPVEMAAGAGSFPLVWVFSIGLIAGGLFLVVRLSRKKP